MPLNQRYMCLRAELYEKLGHILDLSISEIIGNQHLDPGQRIEAGGIQTRCYEELISEIAATYANVQYPDVVVLLEEALQSIQDRISRALKSSYNERILVLVPPQESLSRLQRPSSPPGIFDLNTISEANQCPICYDNIAAKGFTKCRHKVCPYCLEKLVAAATSVNGVSCPLCRQGYPKDVDTDETRRRLEKLLQQGNHTYNRELSPRPWGRHTDPEYPIEDQTHPQYVNHASQYRPRPASLMRIQARPQPHTWPAGSREVHNYPSAAHRHPRSPDSRLERHTVSQPPIAQILPHITRPVQLEGERHFMNELLERGSGFDEELPDWVHKMERDFSMTRH